MNISFSVITFAALIDSVNPCAISVLLLTIGFLSSLKKPPGKIILYGLIFILAIYLTYLLIGTGILQALVFFGIPKAISKFGGFILIFTGVINLLGCLFPGFPVKLEIPAFAKPGIARLLYLSSYPAIFLMGFVVGLFEFPCTGGPYLMVLSLLHGQSTRLNGFLYLLYYNFVFVLPLILILFISTNPRLLTMFAAFRHKNSRRFELFSSLAMLILGSIILILTSL